MTHTILLVQTGEPETRVYSDFESVNECMEGVCRIFEVRVFISLGYHVIARMFLWVSFKKRDLLRIIGEE